MRCEVVPSEVSSVLKFSSPSFSSKIDENADSAYGCISKSGLWLYLIHDTVINIYCMETGKWRGGHSFANSLRNPSAKIKAAIEFESAHIGYDCLVFVIEQDHESLVCLFDVNACRVTQAVLVPVKVTSLDIVSGEGGVCIETHNLSRGLRCMFGIVAVGTYQGHVFFLDLCLDEDFGCDEKLPNITSVVKKNEFSAKKREWAISKKQHVFLHLNDESTSGGSFEFRSRGSILGRFANAAVSVTAVKYIQSLTTLAVGFNFGGFQLWDLHSLMLQYTVADDQHELALVNFAFQEPDNDPRNFCFLWVVKGHSVVEEDLPNSTSVATLYALNYAKREYRDEFGTLYSDLHGCNKKFELPLCGSNPNSSVGTRLLCCQIVNQKDALSSFSCGLPNESESASDDSSQCFLGWEVWKSPEQIPTFHLAVFDLNQWYLAYMPEQFRSNPHGLSSYLGTFSLDLVSSKLSSDILGVYIVPQSVKKFKSLSGAEEFFYPSSLGFQLKSFNDSCQIQATYFGFQKHLLFEIAELGPKVLTNPKDIYSSLLKSGLVTDLHGGVERTPLNVQKESILQLALEYYLPFFFMKCLKEWRYNDSIHEGCTSKAILSWAWKKVIQIKNSIDRLSITLFNCSGVDLDRGSLKQLYGFRRQLTLIDRVMEGYQKYVTPRTEQGLQELHCRKEVIGSINLYLRVLLWLRSSNVLPELIEEEANDDSVVYRSGLLEDSFAARRSKLMQLHSSIEADNILLIDGMVSESGIKNSWLEKNGTGMYPPPSIYAALSCYLLDGISATSKHALMYYVLLDLQNMNMNNCRFKGELKKFDTIFSVPKGVLKLVKAFWYLDVRDCDKAIKKLLHPSVQISDIHPWQHQRIVKSFLYCREPQKALKYVQHMEPPQSCMEDTKLHLSVLLACGAITQAYEYQRKKQISGYDVELLNHLFLGCQETQKLKDLMYLPLDSFESAALIQFLSESEDPKSQESLVIYHLLRCNFFQAEKVNEKLSKDLMNKLASMYEATTYERTVDRDALVEGLMSAISRPERNLFEEIKRLPSGALRMQASVTAQPFSATVKSSAIKSSTYSDIIAVFMNSTLTEEWNPDTPAHTKSSSFYQDLPFLGPPVTPECSKHSYSFKSSNSTVSKRSRLLTSPTEISSPAKRSRLLLDATPSLVASPLAKKKSPKNIASDIASLLQTPPIHRRTSVLKKKGSQQTTITPQSILKKKMDAKKKALDSHLAETPPLLSEDESSEEVMNIDQQEQEKDAANAGTPSRQIRFDLPDSPDSGSPPVSDSAMEEDAGSSASEAEVHAPTTDAHGSTPDMGFGAHKSFMSPLLRKDFPSTEVAKDPKTRIKTPTIVSSIYSHTSVRSFTFHNDEPAVEPTTADDGFKSATPKSEASSSPAASLLGRLIQRSSYLSPRISLCESNTQVSPPEEPKELPTDEVEIYEESSSSTIIEDVPLTEPATEEQLSDKEMFYSPVADNENLYPHSFTFSQPVNLFPEISPSQKPLTEDKKQIDFIETDFKFVEPDVSVAFNESSNDSIEDLPISGSVNICDSLQMECTAMQENKVKPPRKRFVFTTVGTGFGSESAAVGTRLESDSLGNVTEMMEDDQAIMEDLEYKTAPAVDETAKKTRNFVFSALNNSTIYQTRSNRKGEVEPDFTFAAPKITSEDVLQELNASDSQLRSKTQELAEDVPAYSFTFSRPDLSLNNPPEEVKTITKAKDASKYSFAFPRPDVSEIDLPENERIISEVSNSRFIDFRSAVKSSKPPRHTFVFSKNDASSSQEEKIAETLAASSNPSSFMVSTAARSKPSHRKFVFSKVDKSSDDVEKEEHLESEEVGKITAAKDASKYSFAFPRPDGSEIDLPENERIISEVSDKRSTDFRSAGKSAKPPRHTFVFSKKDATSLQEEKIAETLAASSNPSSFMVSTAARSKPSRRKFVFSKVDNNSDSTKKEEHPEFEKPVSATSSFNTQSEKKTRPSRKTFAFSKIDKSSVAAEKEENLELKKPMSGVSSSSILSEKKTRPSRRFVFSNPTNWSKGSAQTEIKEASESGTREKEELMSVDVKTYEQFSSSLKQKNSNEAIGQFDRKALSSPLANESTLSMAATEAKKTKVTKKKQRKEKVSKAVGTTPGLFKSKGKPPKMEYKFSFAEPTSPEPPEIFEAMANTPEVPLPSFIFSPPHTRQRLRKKKMNETMDSSVCSVASDASFAMPPPPVDPILEGIIAEKTLATRKPRSSVKKRNVVRRTQANTSNVSLLSNASLSESVTDSPSKRNSHSMTLRQKSKPDYLL